MEDYIRKAFKSLEDFKVEIEPKETKLREYIEPEEDFSDLTIRDLLKKDSSYIVTYDFEFAGHNYSLFIEALNEGESCDISFEEFDINNVDGVIVEVLDSEHDFIGSLTGEDITLDTVITEATTKAESVITSDEEEAAEDEEDSNERMFINGDPNLKTEPEEPVKEEVLTESDTLSLQNKEEVQKAKEVLEKDSEDNIEQIVDPVAESEEDLKKSYIGSTILQCTTCNAMMYKAPEDVVKAEGDEDIYNVDEECPHCGAHDGFKRIGMVASLDVDPYAEPVPPMVEPESEEESEVSVEEESPIEGEVPEKEEPAELDTSELDSQNEELDKPEDKDKESNKEDKKEEDKQLNEKAPVKEYTEDEIFKAVDDSLKRGGGVAINVDGKVFVCDVDKVPEGGVPKDGNFEFTGCEVTSEDIGVLEDGSLYMTDCEDEKHYVVKDGKIKSEKVSESCKESSCNEEQEDKKENKDKEVCPDCKKEVCECRKEADVKLESFDEDRFDRLITRYLKETYSNVKSYKTVKAGLNDESNKVIMEGLITFKSEKQKPTTFVFEAKEMTAKKQLKLVGINETFSNNKAFTLLGTVDNKKLLSESLSYRYEAEGKKVRGKAETFRKR